MSMASAGLSGKFVGEMAEPIVADLKQRGVLYRGENYTHRYPVCWRCNTDLVFRVVDEWFINMDELRGPNDGDHPPGQLGALVRNGS